MRASRTRRVAIVYVISLVATAAAEVWLSKQPQVPLFAQLAALVLMVPGAYMNWAAYRADRAEAAADVDAKAKTLAAAVTAAETRQRAQLIGPGAHRIDLDFHYQQEPANNAAGADPRGHLADILAYHRRLKPARLVITGDPGAGKTLLALDLLLSLLTDPGRTDTDPTPVRVSLASWDTARPLTQWLTEQVHAQFADQGITAADAQTLVDQYRVLPVLDGLDEMDTEATDTARTRAARALDQLNAYQHPSGNTPVVLTCRTAQYDQLAALDLRMREAARIEITPVTAAQATAYLTARTTNPTRWAPVLTTLATAPTGTLARALSTPWRLNLAATAYEERHPDTRAYLRDPADLLTLASPSTVRDHLLGHYLSAATGQHPTQPDRYHPDQVHRWLAVLAAHLAATATAGAGTDLVLHELWPLAGPRRVRTADALLATLFAVLLPLALTALVLVSDPIASPLRKFIGAALIALLGLWTVWRASSATTPPPRIGQLQRLRNPVQRRQLARALAPRLVLGIAIGLAFGLVFAFQFEHGRGLAFGFEFGLPVGLVGGVMVGLTFGLAFGLSTPVAATAHGGGFAPTDPRSPVHEDFTIGVALGFGFGVAFGFTSAIVFGPPFETLGLMFGLCAFTGAGRRYVVFRCCSRNRLPWHLGSFLHWSYGAGLLRISGIGYQFRHRELQDWLAAHPLP